MLPSPRVSRILVCRSLFFFVMSVCFFDAAPTREGLGIRPSQGGKILQQLRPYRNPKCCTTIDGQELGQLENEGAAIKVWGLASGGSRL